MITRREFAISAAILVAVPVLSVSLLKGKQDDLFYVHFRWEHPNGMWWTEGNISYRTFLKTRDSHIGYKLVLLERIED